MVTWEHPNKEIVLEHIRKSKELPKLGLIFPNVSPSQNKLEVNLKCTCRRFFKLVHLGKSWTFSGWRPCWFLLFNFFWSLNVVTPRQFSVGIIEYIHRNLSVGQCRRYFYNWIILEFPQVQTRRSDIMLHNRFPKTLNDSRGTWLDNLPVGGNRS